MEEIVLIVCFDEAVHSVWNVSAERSFRRGEEVHEKLPAEAFGVLRPQSELDDARGICPMESDKTLFPVSRYWGRVPII